MEKHKSGETLKEKIDAFLREGGEIEHIPSGISKSNEGPKQIVIAPPSDISMIKLRNRRSAHQDDV